MIQRENTVGKQIRARNMKKIAIIVIALSILALASAFSMGLVHGNENYEKFHIPTRWELKDMVLESHVSGKAYNAETYDCTEFSNDLIKYLKEEGVFSCVAEVDFKDPITGDSRAHDIVAVETDNGIYYVEPQSAKIIESRYLSAGDNYCKKADFDCDWKITKLSSCYELKILGK